MAVKALGKHDPENVFAYLLHFAFTGNGIEYRDAIAHPLYEAVGYGFIYRYDIFFLVVIARTEYLVHYVAIVSHKNKPLTGLIKTPYREYPFRIIDIVYDIIPHVRVCGAFYAYRLIEGKIDMLSGFFPYQFTEFEQASSSYEKVMNELDFLSGMTDEYATEMFRRLKGIAIPGHR